MGKSELYGGTYMHHCMKVMSEAFCCRFVVVDEAHIRQLAICKYKKGRTGSGRGTATRPKLLTKAPSMHVGQRLSDPLRENEDVLPYLSATCSRIEG